MKTSITLYGLQRRRLERQVQKCSDALHTRRILVVLYLADGQSVSAVRAVWSRRRCAALHAVFYVDEADVELNPRIGYGWMRRDRQRKVPTPGQNQRRYLAGALHANTGKLVWVQGPNKNTHMFIALLETLHRTYRRARRLSLILDNYTIHKSRAVQQWLANLPRVRLLFQPA